MLNSLYALTDCNSTLQDRHLTLSAEEELDLGRLSILPSAR